MNIYSMTENEKKMKSAIIRRWAPRLGMTETGLAEIVDSASIEFYQEKPFTTVVIKKTVRGKQVRGLGFVKYNPNDAKLGPKYQWESERGRIKALSRAFASFMNKMPKSNQSIRVMAMVEGTKELCAK